MLADKEPSIIASIGTVILVYLLVYSIKIEEGTIC